MKLGGKEGLMFMFHPFIGLVIQVNEEGLPIRRQGSTVYGKTMILRGNICFVRIHKQYRLIMAPMTILEFIGIGTRSQAE